MDKRITDHAYSPEEDSEGEFINCKWCGAPKGLHEYPIPHPDDPNPTRVNDKGIYPKYLVFRHPEEELAVVMASHMHVHGDPPLSHEHSLEMVDDFCFVLKPESDRHARVAIAAYAQSVMEDNPMLGEELMQIIADGPRK